MNQALSEWAAGHGVPLKVRLRCTSLVQVAAAVTTLGMAAVLPTWAESAFDQDAAVRVPLPAFETLKTPLRLAWSRRQAAIRPFLARLARTLAAALAS